MRKSYSLTSCFAASSLLVLLAAGPAHAQATRTWVSGVGDDANPCSRTAPCKTFAGAISKTALNGEINCIDPGGFGAVTITKSITIDCSEVFGSILNSGTNGVNVPFDNFGPTDTRKTVRLRGINLNGASTGINGIRITGASAAGVVMIEDCVIDGNLAGAARGVSDERSGGGELYVSRTVVRNSGSGIVVNPLNGTAAGQRIDATLYEVRVQNGVFGAVFGSNVRSSIDRSMLSGHSQAGVLAATTFAGLAVQISNSLISGNATGVLNGGGPVSIRIAASDISFNATALNGATQSYGNNRMESNTTLGTVPTPIGLR